MTKDYFYKLCPECSNYTEYIPNPAYIHTCESCGKEGLNESDLITVIKKEEVQKDINHLKDLLKRFPTRDSFIQNLK